MRFECFSLCERSHRNQPRTRGGEWGGNPLRGRWGSVGASQGFREKVLIFSKMMVKVTHADEALDLPVMEPGDGRDISTRGEGRPSVSWESNTYHLSLWERTSETRAWDRHSTDSYCTLPSPIFRQYLLTWVNDIQFFTNLVWRGERGISLEEMACFVWP